MGKVFYVRSFCLLRQKLKFSSQHSYIKTPCSPCLSTFFLNVTVFLDAGVQIMREILLSFIVSEETFVCYGPTPLWKPRIHDSFANHEFVCDVRN